MFSFISSFILLFALHIKRLEHPTNLILLTAFVSVLLHLIYFLLNLIVDSGSSIYDWCNSDLLF